MSEENGMMNESWRERFDRLEKSHVQLMADHEVFRREQDTEWERQKERWAKEEKRWAEQAKRDAARDLRMDVLVERIDGLVSGIGALVAKIGDRDHQTVLARVEAVERKLGIRAGDEEEG